MVGLGEHEKGGRKNSLLEGIEGLLGDGGAGPDRVFGKELV